MNPLKITAAALAFTGLVGAQTFIGQFPLTTTNALPVGLEHDGAGNLWFTDLGAAAEIGRCDVNGNVLVTYSVAANTPNPIGITTDGTNVYVTDTSVADVDVYDLVGNYISSFAVGAFTTFPEGITFNPVTGNLYVVDGTASNVFEFTTAGTNVASFPLNGTSVDGIAYDISSNSYWIYDSGTDSIRNYDSSFNQLSAVPGTNAFHYPHPAPDRANRDWAECVDRAGRRESCRSTRVAARVLLHARCFTRVGARTAPASRRVTRVCRLVTATRDRAQCLGGRGGGSCADGAAPSSVRSLQLSLEHLPHLGDVG